ncbi:hypothetical protein [Natrinema gari]|uniref:Uncharacterized protein n=1 Tax=Natrinema gari JCM 14663 TaxID=1230459 RepID=L9ZFC3_9EURY|nr:hypothetical protein [Natrinema gari]ELY84746.1 hypothetical protein C486_00405 [Natrinema gari JCM 14663]
MNDVLSETVRHGLSIKYFAAGTMFGFGLMFAIQPSVSTPLERYGVGALVAAIGVFGWAYVRAEESEYRTAAVTDDMEDSR